MGRQTWTSISCLAQPRGCRPELKPCGAVRKAESRRSDGYREKKRNSSQFEGTSLDFRVHLAVRRPHVVPNVPSGATRPEQKGLPKTSRTNLAWYWRCCWQ